jgi:hypothetical protein
MSTSLSSCTISHKIYTLKAVDLISCSNVSPKSPLYPCSSRYCLKRVSSLSKSRSRLGINVQAMMPPVAANAAPMRKTACVPLNVSEKEFLMGVKTSVPIAAPAFPTAAARPRK